ncbi:type II secretion system F family protein, partial [Candidatus Poseidonia alphae]|nr:type II secretion system F family protein [Candidatus Poseidonia alphae]
LAEYWKGGLSMTVAVQTLATSEYGALNDEVKKMSDQLSWGVKFSDVILQFAERVGTPLVRRAIALIAEADRAGGKISDILVTAANDSRELKFLEGERRRAIGSYIAVIWTSYFVFLGVIVVLAKVFIPAIAGSNSSGDDGGDSGGQTIGNMTIRNIDPLFFLTIFYYGVTMQALGNGSMAGLMATGRFSTGFKHSGMMIVVALVIFNFVAFSPDLIGVTDIPGLNPSRGTFVPSPLFWG